MNRNLRESPLEIHRPSQYTVHNTQYIGKLQEGCVDVGGGRRAARDPLVTTANPHHLKFGQRACPPTSPSPPQYILGGGDSTLCKMEKKYEFLNR